MRMSDRLDALAREIDANHRKSERARADLADERLSVDLPCGAGSVCVTGHGQLVEIDLDPYELAVRHVSGAVLADQLVTCVHAAEAAAAARMTGPTEESHARQ